MNSNRLRSLVCSAFVFFAPALAAAGTTVTARHVVSDTKAETGDERTALSPTQEDVYAVILPRQLLLLALALVAPPALLTVAWCHVRGAHRQTSGG